MKRADLQQRCKEIRKLTGRAIDCRLSDTHLREYIDAYEEQRSEATAESAPPHVATTANKLAQMDMSSLDDYCRANPTVCEDDDLWKELFSLVFPEVYEITRELTLPNLEKDTKRKWLPWRNLYYEFIAASANPDMLDLVDKILNNENIFHVPNYLKAQLAKRYDMLNYVLGIRNPRWRKELVFFQAPIATVIFADGKYVNENEAKDILNFAIEKDNIPIIEILLDRVPLPSLLAAAGAKKLPTIRYSVSNIEADKKTKAQLFIQFIQMERKDRDEIIRFLLQSPQFDEVVRLPSLITAAVKAAAGGAFGPLQLLLTDPRVGKEGLNQAFISAIENNSALVVDRLLSEFDIDTDLLNRGFIAGVEVSRNDEFKAVLDMLLRDPRFDVQQLLSQRPAGGRLPPLLSVAATGNNSDLVSYLLGLSQGGDVVGHALRAAVRAQAVEAAIVLLHDDRITTAALNSAAQQVFRHPTFGYSDRKASMLAELLLSDQRVDSATTEVLFFGALRWNVRKWIGPLLDSPLVTSDTIISALTQLRDDPRYPALDDTPRGPGIAGITFTDEERAMEELVRQLHQRNMKDALEFIANTPKLYQLAKKKELFDI